MSGVILSQNGSISRYNLTMPLARPWRSRETLIALRACHTAHRLANDIVYSPTEALEEVKLRSVPTVPTSPGEVYDPHQYTRVRRRFFSKPTRLEWGVLACVALSYAILLVTAMIRYQNSP